MREKYIEGCIHFIIQIYCSSPKKNYNFWEEMLHVMLQKNKSVTEEMGCH